MTVRRDGVTWQEVDGHVVVLDLRSSLYLELNRAGSLLWNALVDGGDLARLPQVLQTAYGVTADVAAADTQTFLDQLRGRDLLTS